jgi:hypothetical protein
VTASRYYLMATTADDMVARQFQLDLAELRVRMEQEIAFLEASTVTDDTVPPVDQRRFLNFSRAVAAIQ